MTKLCPRGKAAAKRKFKVYPSAYANAYASKICAGKIKDPSGVKRKDFRGSKAEGGLMEATSRLKRQGLKDGTPRSGRPPSSSPRKIRRALGPAGRGKPKKDLEARSYEAGKENIFANFRKAVSKAEKQYKNIPSGMKKDPKTDSKIKLNLLKSNRKNPFKEFKDSRREVFATERMAKGGRAGLKGGGICKKGMNRQAVGKNS